MNFEPKVLDGGSDFDAFPRMDLQGERIAWIIWHHPNMPWDKTELWVGYISENGDFYKRICIAGFYPTLMESPTEPKWSSNGELFFVIDRKSGFWNLHKSIESSNVVLAVYTMVAEVLILGNDCLYVEGASAVQLSSVAKVTLDDHKLKAVDFKIV